MTAESGTEELWGFRRWVFLRPRSADRQHRRRPRVPDATLPSVAERSKVQAFGSWAYQSGTMHAYVPALSSGSGMLKCFRGLACVNPALVLTYNRKVVTCFSAKLARGHPGAQVDWMDTGSREGRSPPFQA